MVEDTIERNKIKKNDKLGRLDWPRGSHLPSDSMFLCVWPYVYAQ